MHFLCGFTGSIILMDGEASYEALLVSFSVVQHCLKNRVRITFFQCRANFAGEDGPMGNSVDQKTALQLWVDLLLDDV